MMIRNLGLFVLGCLMFVGCVPVAIINFISNVELSVSCEISVRTDNLSLRVFYTEPAGESVASILDAMELSDFDTEGEIFLYYSEFTVSRFIKVGNIYWFGVELTGLRSFTPYTNDETSQASQFLDIGAIFGAPSSNDIATGFYWIPESVVMDANPNLTNENGCMQMIIQGTLEESGIEQVFLCSIVPLSTDLPVEFRVGPGNNRFVRFVSTGGFEYNVLGIYEDWLQVRSEDYGLVWVNWDDVEKVGDCTRVAYSEPPPINPPLDDNPEESNSPAGDCSTFKIITPIDIVPEEFSIYSWTPINDADFYELRFFNYQGDFANSIQVNSPQTSLRVHTGSLSTGSQLTFEVRAYKQIDEYDETFLCSTGRSQTITRLAPFTELEEEVVQTKPEKEKKEKKNGGGYTPPDEGGE